MSVLMLAALPAAATEIDFTYNEEGKEPEAYGMDRKDSYDIAIKVVDPSYIGARVTGLTVGMPVDVANLTEISGWVSSELRLTDKANDPDLCTQGAEVSDGVLDIKFSNPVAIPEGGVWVGYSFTVTTSDKKSGKPVMVVGSSDNLDYGLWVHTKKSYPKWTNIAEKKNIVSAMVVHLDADFGPSDVALTLPSDSYIVGGEDSRIGVTLINHGNEALEDVGYTYSFGGVSASAQFHLDEPLAAGGTKGFVRLPIPATSLQYGEYPFTLTIDTCNGNADNDPGRSASGVMNVWPFIPVTRPLVEEFSGLACGACPVGYVAMEELAKRHGDLFVGLAYHSESFENGCMETVANADFPIPVPYLPYADFNRSDVSEAGDLVKKWPEFAARTVPVGVEVKAGWENDVIDAEADFRFAKDAAGEDYKVAFALTASGLHNDRWKQSNYLSGQTDAVEFESDLWDIFINGPEKIPGLVYNDVVAYFKDVKGESGLLPAAIAAGESVTCHYSIPFDEVVNLKGKTFINNDATLSVVAMLIDAATGEVVNCNRSAELAVDKSLVDEIEGVSEVVDVIYTTIDGIRVSATGKGFILRTEVHADGSRRTTGLICR